MATIETWVLDGVALTSGNFTILELNVDPPKSRADWISAADSEGAAVMRQPLHENRTITMKLRVAQQASMNAALDQVGVIADELRDASSTPDGIALVWTPANSTRSWTFDVLAGAILEMPITLEGHGYSWFKQRPIITIEMTAKPYARAAEVLTSTAASSTPITTLEVANVPGDIPALGRLIVSDTATQNRRHVEWGVEGQNYNSGTSLILDSDSFVTSGFAGTQTTLTGAYDPGAAGNSIVTCNMFTNPVAMLGTGNLSHIGSFRVYARVQTDVTTAWIRFAWQEGDGPFMALPWQNVPNSGSFFEIPFGPIVVAEKKSGTQRWTGRIETLSTSGNGSMFVDYLLFIPCAEGWGKASAPWSTTPTGAVVGYDQFTGTTAAAALNARVATLGGTWATSGSATDWVFTDEFNDEVNEAVVRNAVSEAGNGRFAIIGATSYTNTAVQARVAWVNNFTGLQTGVILRWVDANNYLLARIICYVVGTVVFELVQRVAGVETILMARTPVSVASRQPVYISAAAYTTGRITATLLENNGVTQLATLDTIQTVAATGGALQTGKPGFVDKQSTTAAASRYIDDFQVTTPGAEPIALYSGRTLEFRYDDVIRQDSAGTYYGRPQSYNGSRFLVPVGTSRVAAKARRNNVDVDSDSQVTDSTTIQVGYQPRALVVPRS